MSAAATGPGARYLRFVALVVTVAGALGLVGYPATLRLGPPGGVTAMGVALGISVIASALGGVPLLLLAASTPAQRLNLVLGAMLVRLLAALLLGVAAALSGWLTTGPLLIWLAVSYLVLLAVDTAYAVSAATGAAATERNRT